MGVVSIVKKKMDQVKFAAMLACFMKRACSVESQRVARLVGNVDDDPEQFAVQTREEYNKLVKIQGDEELTTLKVETLRGKGRESDSSEHGHQGMDGTSIEQLCTFFQKVTRMLKYVSVRLAQVLDAIPVHSLAPSQNIINVPCIFIIRCSSSVNLNGLCIPIIHLTDAVANHLSLTKTATGRWIWTNFESWFAPPGRQQPCSLAPKTCVTLM